MGITNRRLRLRRYKNLLSQNHHQGHHLHEGNNPYPMNMRIPFQISAKGMKNTDETGSKKFCFVVFVKHAKDNIANSRKKAVEKRTILEKKRTQFFSNSKNTMAVLSINDFKRHSGSSVNGIFVSTSRTETAVATKRNKFKSSTISTTIHGTTKCGIAAVKHFIHVFNNGLSWMEQIYHFFIMVCKNVL